VSEPVRTCVGCGARGAPRELVRLRVVDGRVEVDAGRSGGRGAWVHAREACLARAERRRAYGRALRAPHAIASAELARDVLTRSVRKD